MKMSQVVTALGDCDTVADREIVNIGWGSSLQTDLDNTQNKQCCALVISLGQNPTPNSNSKR